ncbi:esterase [Leptolyngbya sp. BL0902]|uniref:YqiA/YcfP family alpha/beta fold hydrolase n=1 Tax=Leptolyngbya sp. BL0902 TaxID=1115757 RepID=UPI0018E76571|nr:YqiA/YcfP family alpha/beta fold hydrolase [Leptolyngbya sp. BL0902]QQE63424.1 esterase [Leptolyngbya sp. BL0902]
MVHYLYLHGFASGPQSYKAQVFRARFEALGLSLTIPDLNQGGFANLTLSRQIQQARELILAQAQPTVIIGSSFGGLTAAWLADQPDLQPRIDKLVLLAPAFQFAAQWLPRLGATALAEWQQQGVWSVYHYADQEDRPLNYNFVADLQRYDEATLQAQIPTLICHGLADEVISIDASHAYVAQRPWGTLLEFASDHTLGNVEDDIWQAMSHFLGLTSGR